VLSDEIGTGKARFDTSVTTFTGTDTIDVSEAGTILVSASSPYTLTLPTPVDNVGLTYKFKKTDFNYNLITVATTAGQFNYENADSALKDTYPRLNTGGAEATFVSDGANWQVINEALGQVPECRVYLNNLQEDIYYNTWTYIQYDTEAYDIGSNYDVSEWVSGTATTDTLNHLVDTTAGGQFTSDMVGRRVENTTDGGIYATITAFTDATDITLSADIFPDGTDNYQIKNSKFVCPIAGSYSLFLNLCWSSTNMVIDKDYNAAITLNGTNVVENHNHSSAIYFLSHSIITNAKASISDEFSARVRQKSGANDLIVQNGNNWAFVIKLISKD